MNQKVMIYAYSNFNLGDDLFIKLLCDRYPNTEFYLYAPKEYKDTFKNIKNIKILPNNSFLVRVTNFIFRLVGSKTPIIRREVAKRCDAAVYIGGSLFMQTEDWEKKYEDKENMYIENKPFYLIGSNFGPYHDREFYETYKRLFAKFTDVSFREVYSYELFKELSNVRMADDVVFQLGKKAEETENKSNTVVISIIKPSIRKSLINYDEIYYEKIKQIIINLSEKGFQATLMSFCEKEGDEEAIEKVLELLPEKYAKNTKKYFYKNDVEEALKVIKGSSFVVATRFHSMILGWVYNKPVFPIVYSKKMTNVMQDVGFKGLYTELKHIDSLDAEDVYKSVAINNINITRQIENSEIHFKMLDKLLLD